MSGWLVSKKKPEGSRWGPGCSDEDADDLVTVGGVWLSLKTLSTDIIIIENRKVNDIII